MNYRHAYHAGNFADVLKHAILCLCVEHLKLKPQPFRVIDTHAGRGLYDLAGVEAGKTLEAAEGIARLVGVDAEALPAPVAAALAPYLDCVRAENESRALSLYPGSPRIVRQLMREGDALVVNELHPEEHAALGALFDNDPLTKVLALDGWTALKALLPPKEKRGLVLVDPPFEERGDYERLSRSLAEARRRFETGTYLLWSPIKDPLIADRLAEAARDALGPDVPAEKALRVELMIRAPKDPTRLNGCGLLIVNPPWTLRKKLDLLLPFLAARLAQGPGATARVVSF